MSLYILLIPQGIRSLFFFLPGQIWRSIRTDAFDDVMKVNLLNGILVHCH